MSLYHLSLYIEVSLQTEVSRTSYSCYDNVKHGPLSDTVIVHGMGLHVGNPAQLDGLAEA